MHTIQVSAGAIEDTRVTPEYPADLMFTVVLMRWRRSGTPARSLLTDDRCFHEIFSSLSGAPHSSLATSWWRTAGLRRANVSSALNTKHRANALILTDGSCTENAPSFSASRRRYQNGRNIMVSTVTAVNTQWNEKFIHHIKPYSILVIPYPHLRPLEIIMKTFLYNLKLYGLKFHATKCKAF